jgi:hypothetical protein
MEIETRSFQMQINLSQIIVQPAIHHAQVQEEAPLQLKYSSPPTIINRISFNTGPVSAFWGQGRSGRRPRRGWEICNPKPERARH